MNIFQYTFFACLKPTTTNPQSHRHTLLSYILKNKNKNKRLKPNVPDGQQATMAMAWRQKLSLSSPQWRVAYQSLSLSCTSSLTTSSRLWRCLRRSRWLRPVSQKPISCSTACMEAASHAGSSATTARCGGKGYEQVSAQNGNLYAIVLKELHALVSLHDLLVLQYMHWLVNMHYAIRSFDQIFLFLFLMTTLGELELY